MVRHQARIERYSDQGLTDVYEDFVIPLLEVAKHKVESGLCWPDSFWKPNLEANCAGVRCSLHGFLVYLVAGQRAIVGRGKWGGLIVTWGSEC